MNRRRIALIVLLLMVAVIIVLISLWHRRDGRVTVRPSLRFDVEVEGAEVLLGEQRLGGGKIEEVLLDPKAPYAIELPDGWTTSDLVNAVRQQLNLDDDLRIDSSGIRSDIHSEQDGPSGCVDHSYAVLHRTREDGTVEPMVAIGWRVLDEDFAVLVRFEHAWRKTPPVVSVGFGGGTRPVGAWFLDDRLVITSQCGIVVFFER